MICNKCKHRKSPLFMCDHYPLIALCGDCFTVEDSEKHEIAHGEGCLTAVHQDSTSPLGSPIADAFIAGFFHGLNRTSWDDMHDYIALVAIEYAMDRPIPKNLEHPIITPNLSDEDKERLIKEWNQIKYRHNPCAELKFPDYPVYPTKDAMFCNGNPNVQPV